MLHLKSVFNILLILTVFTFSAYSQNTDSHIVPGLLQVKFKRSSLKTIQTDIQLDQFKDTEVRSVLRRWNFTEGRKIFSEFNPKDTLAVSLTGEQVKLKDLSTWYVIKIADTSNLTLISERLKKLPSVIAVTPVHKVDPLDVFPNDPRFQQGNQWGLYNYGNPGADIHAPAAWEYNKGRSDVIVAVVDGGVDYNHNDLDPGDRSRVIQGRDTGDDDNNPMDDAPEGGNSWGAHGTKVAGVIGAITNNNQKVAGVMWNLKIMPIKVAKTDPPWWGPIFGFSSGQAFDTDIAEGIDWARTHGANIINMSFGGEGQGFWENLIIGNPIAEATWNAYQQGILLVAAMGNDGNNNIMYPAGYDWVMAVGASDWNDNRTSFSNYGSWINLVAPGIGHYTTFRNQSDGSFSGTSCSAPMISGVAGLILSESRDRGLNLTNDDIWHLMEKTADKVPGMQGQYWHQEYGFGRVNADRALQYLQDPYTVKHSTSYGGSSQLTWDDHWHTFYNNGGLASGNYVVEQYKITKTVNFSPAYQSVPLVWARERTTNGWSGANPNDELPYVNVKNVTTTSVTFETFVYYVKYNILGQSINQWYPASPSNVKIDYTIIGIEQTPPPLTVNITGPTHLNYGEVGEFTAHPSGGSGTYINYKWWSRNDEGGIVPYILNGGIVPNAPPVGEWIYMSQWEGHQSITMGPSYDFSLKCEVTDSDNNTATDIHSVIVGGPSLSKEQQNENISIIMVPTELTLAENYPNPFNPTTTIRFGLPEAQHVLINVYSIKGELVTTLINDYLSEGYHQVIWDGTNSQGSKVGSGIYIYEMRTKNKRLIKRMLLVK